ncbi:MAG: DUF177 domain-containing protein [Clostridiales bacterium]|nr:DUF177 domain-containing protein [Clostridiales bacterium]
MLINLSELLPNEGKIKEVIADFEPKVFSTKLDDYEIIDKKPINFILTTVDKKTILVEAKVELSLIIPCDRCLEPVKRGFNIKINREVDMAVTDLLEEDKLDQTNFMSGNNLDVNKIIHNEILLDLPMKVLCDENCKGICNRCGANLNHGTCDCDITELDPRMAVIRDIFKNS